MTTQQKTQLWNIFVIMILYVLQGINVGLAASIPLFIGARGAMWKNRSVFNFVYYPFSLKLLWAPLADSLYIKRFGRRKTWLVPVQFLTAGLLILLSFYINSFIDNNDVIPLTVIVFGIIALTATQDICVDGLAITLFTETNPQWVSTSQTIGQTMGRLVGSSFLLTCESANFTNRFIRKPLSLPPQESGLFSLPSFLQFEAAAFIIITICLMIFLHEKSDASSTNIDKTNALSIKETYLSIWQLFKKKCIQQLTLATLLSPMGLVAINYMTALTLLSKGVPRESLAIIYIPVTICTLVAPLLLRKTKLPLAWFAGSYVLFLVSGIPIAIYVYFTPQIISFNYYYPVLILLLAFNDFIMIIRSTAQIGFYASVCEPRIGGTYMTLLVTLHNLGFAVHSSITLYIASFLPKNYAFVIAVAGCTVIGIIWLALSARTLRWLQTLATEEWYLQPKQTADEPTQPNEKTQNDLTSALISSGEVDTMT